MSKPTKLAMSLICRLVRYLLGQGEIMWIFDFQEGPVDVIVLADSDHATDTRSRKSITSVHVFHGRHLIDADGGFQQVIAISSGEAEFYAIGRGAANGILLVNILKECGCEPKSPQARIFSDSSAARGMCKRTGVGKVKHMQVRFLWVQERVATKEISIESIDTTLNTADLGTKYLDAGTRATLMAMMPLRFSTLQELGLALVLAPLMFDAVGASRNDIAIVEDRQATLRAWTTFAKVFVTLLIGIVGVAAMGLRSISLRRTITEKIEEVKKPELKNTESQTDFTFVCFACVMTDNFTVDYLKAIAKEIGLRGVSGLNKKPLILALLNSKDFNRELLFTYSTPWGTQKRRPSEFSLCEHFEC
jgi:hypothetical protein